ncbi:MAG: hypothetical protein HQL82_08295 [Magnetococcales bacterium]|nr:hypothetical protein [Magnetococcales bacterium]
MKRLHRILLVTTLALVLGLAGSGTAGAGEMITSGVRHADGVYHLTLEMRLRGRADLLRSLILDFDHLEQLNPTIVASARLTSPNPDVARMRITLRDCVLIFCPQLVQTQEVRQSNDGSLLVTILPEASDYSAGRSVWTFTQEENQITRIRVEAMLAPRIFIPPLVGPAMVGQLFQTRSEEMLANLETLARDLELAARTPEMDSRSRG